jgi:hypothetical protein
MTMTAALRQRLTRDEQGFALVLALGVMTVLAIMIVTIVQYSSSNQRTAYYSKAKVTAFDAADAGINNTLSVLNLPTNNSLHSDILPPCHDPATSDANKPSVFSSASNFYQQSNWNHTTYGNATVDWCGDLDLPHAQWYLWSVGHLKNPTGPKAGNVSKTLSAKVSVTPTLTQPLNNPVWNYLYAGHTGSTCDQTLNNNISGSSRMYVAGNLCLSPNVILTQSSVIVGNNVNVANNAAIGANTNMSTRVETYVGGNCLYGTGSWVTCSGNQDANHIYSKLSDGTTIAVNHTPPVVPPPTADFATWYANAIPGPKVGCTTSSGTIPTFDNNTTRDNSVATVFDLTPSSSYTCRVGPGASTTLTGAMTATQTTVSVTSASGFPTSQFQIRIDDEYMTVTGGFGTTTWTVTRGVGGSTATTHAIGQTVTWSSGQTDGELSWNATTKTLTVTGTIYIDGSAKVSNGALNVYNGQATLYLSGTFWQNGSLCGAISGTACNFSGWNPNSEMLTIVANGSGGQVNPGDSIQVANNFSFQGGLFGTNNVELGNNVNVDGPIVGSQIILSNNLSTNAFPTITTVPVGMPSNPAVYAQPNPPQSFSG